MSVISVSGIQSATHRTVPWNHSRSTDPPLRAWSRRSLRSLSSFSSWGLAESPFTVFKPVTSNCSNVRKCCRERGFHLVLRQRLPPVPNVGNVCVSK